MTSYHVSATSHWPNYLPEYIAVANGYFADEGLEFSRDAPDDWTGVLRSLADGSAQAVLGGLWVPAMYHGRGHHFVAFAQLNARNPKAIVTREPQPELPAVRPEGKLVLAPGAGGTAPYMHTAGLIRQAGIDLSAIRFIRDLSGQTLSDLFAGGLGDAIIVDLVNAHLLEHKGIGTIAYRHADAGGSMPNSVYYTLPHLIGDPGSAPWRFTRAIQRATDWMNDHDGSDCTDLLTQLLATAPPRGSDRQRRRPQEVSHLDRRPHRPRRLRQLDEHPRRRMADRRPPQLRRHHRPTPRRRSPGGGSQLATGSRQIPSTNSATGPAR